ncbi:hypothetical protein, conserved [Leishmania tarentolae]|uniref:Uncharacterized protein n=1 Tax=Leishmania tarentolae TaxID=5689 RepID=A0A640KKJ3_LEITA|nr:hypothetical protein, conserved [Leishmania tarentolae]
MLTSDRTLAMTDLTKRQWRALAQASPFYLAGEAGVGGLASERLLDRREGLTESEPADASLSSSEEFVQYVVPRVAKVFPDELQAYEQCNGCGRQPDHSKGDGLCCASAPSASEAVDALLMYLFDCTTSALSQGSSVEQTRACASACFSSLITPLSRREQQLLGLYHRKQEQYIYVLSTQRQLLAASQLAVQTLQGVSGPMLTYTQGGASASRRGGEENLTVSTRNSAVFLGNQNLSSRPPPSHATVSGDGTCFSAVQVALSSRAPAASSASSCDVSRAFGREQATLPYERHPQEMPAAEALPVNGSSVAGTRGGSRFCDAPTAPASLLAAMSRCAGCHEVGGDLLLCPQCEEVRHEACGGPHPPEPSKTDKKMPTMSVCKRCAKELNLSSSSSSLRSTTSSSERAELDEYFNSDDESSSLSGFIVNTSDDEVEDDDQSVDDSCGSDGDSAKGNGRCERQQKKHQSKSASSPSRKGQHINKDRKRRCSAGDTQAASERSSASSASSGSSSRIWSRSASLDRALATAAKRKGKKDGLATKADAGDDEGESGAAAPRSEGREGQRCKRHRVRYEDEEGGRRRYKRKRSAADASDTSSLTSSTSSCSWSLPVKKMRALRSSKEKVSSQNQGSTQVPPSPPRQEGSRRMPTRGGKEGMTHSPVDCGSVELLSAQPRRGAMLEDEEELRTLGIASCSASGTPLQQRPSSSKRRQGDAANRHAGCGSFTNVASSSSSSDDRN